MIALSFVLGVGVYALLGIFVISVIAKSSTKKWLMGIAIIILIPTWDVIIGYPIFYYLCKYKAGVKIYKTVDNVEGFYLGEWDKKVTPRMPYKNYKYVDFKITGTDKYFRSYWLDKNTSEKCNNSENHNSNESMNVFIEEEKCFATMPIQTNIVSRYELLYEHGGGEKIIPFIQLRKKKWLKIMDKQTGVILAEGVRFRWNRGWLRSTLLNVSDSKGIYCPPYGDSKKMIIETLKTN